MIKGTEAAVHWPAALFGSVLAAVGLLCAGIAGTAALLLRPIGSTGTVRPCLHAWLSIE